MTLSAEAAVLHAIIERDVEEATRLLDSPETWSLTGIWLFKKHAEELVSFLEVEYWRRQEEAAEHGLQREREGD